MLDLGPSRAVLTEHSSLAIPEGWTRVGLASPEARSIASWVYLTADSPETYESQNEWLLAKADLLTLPSGYSPWSAFTTASGSNSLRARSDTCSLSLQGLGATRDASITGVVADAGMQDHASSMVVLTVLCSSD